MMSRIYKIGRSEKNDIVLTHPSIASFHAEVYVDPQGNCFYTDLSTLSGTKLNGIKMNQPALLSPNDQLMLGEGQELDWEMIFFKRVSIHKQPKKVKIEETIPPLKQQSPPTPKQSPKPKPVSTEKSVELSSQPFLRKNLDLILIFSGIILLLFVLSIM
jgi:pSer/pThr/pTyr-binding forkhead associated (FHA) protein